MDGGTGVKRNNRKAMFITSDKGQEFVMIADVLGGGTRHI